MEWVRRQGARLPAPHGGWARAVLLVAAVIAVWAIIAYTITALAIPLMDPECYSDFTGGRVCPLEEHRDPGLTHLYETRWPAASESFVGIVLLAGVGLTAALYRFSLRTWEPWPAQSYSGVHIILLCGALGTGLGLVVGGAGYTDPRMLLSVTGVGIVVCALSGLGARGVIRSVASRS